MFGRSRTPASSGPNTAATTTSWRHAPRQRISAALAALFALFFIFGAVALGLMVDIVVYFNSNFERIIPDWIEARAGYATFVAAFTVASSLLYFLLGAVWRGFRWYHVVTLTVLNFIFWIIAAPLLHFAFIHTPYGSCVVIFGQQKCDELKAARAFAWILVVLSLFAIPLAWYFGQKAEESTSTQPLVQEAYTGHNPYNSGTTGTAAPAPTNYNSTV